MVEIPCATLTGAADLDTDHSFFVLNSSAFRSRDDFNTDLDRLLGRLRAIVSSDPQHDMVGQRRENGILMVQTLVDEVRLVCSKSRAAFILDAG